MAKLIPAAERITRARALIQKARDFPLPEAGKYDLTYMASVKSLLRDARDLVKFIAYSPSPSKETKAEAAALLKEADEAEKAIFRG